jgi:hypothetical protein
LHFFFFATSESDSVFDLVKNGQISNTAGENQENPETAVHVDNHGPEKNPQKKNVSLLSLAPQIDFQSKLHVEPQTILWCPPTTKQPFTCFTCFTLTRT